MEAGAAPQRRLTGGGEGDTSYSYLQTSNRKCYVFAVTGELLWQFDIVKLYKESIISGGYTYL